jgi:hypothetical protein
VFAAVHTAITLGLVYWQEVPFWEYIPTVAATARRVPHEAVADDAEDRAPLNPCELANDSDRPTSPQEKIVALDNLPIALITGWHLPCSEPSRLDQFIQARYGFTQNAERVTGWLMSALALVLWFIVGGFPFVRRRHRRWYTEPGLFMTLCALVSMLLLGIAWSISRAPLGFAVSVADILTRIAVVPMFFVVAGWVWWVGLFFYSRWKKTRRWLDRRALAAD